MVIANINIDTGNLVIAIVSCTKIRSNAISIATFLR